MYIFYRISDGFQKTVNSDSQVVQKEKPDYITKKNCFVNFLQNFSSQNIFIIADNVSEETFQWILSKFPYQSKIIRTNIGHGAGSFQVAVNNALRLNPEDNVYFLEDDYLHLPKSDLIIQEGLEIGDYVTLYDHPDKYVNYGEKKNKCVGNPYIQNNSEQTRVYLGTHCHWKETNSTTMTFATKVRTLQQDIDIIYKYTSGSFPHDFAMFQELIKSKGRKLISSIPGYCTHGETAYLTPLTDWSKV